jgi:hypothetical protein
LVFEHADIAKIPIELSRITVEKTVGTCAISLHAALYAALFWIFFGTIISNACSFGGKATLEAA